MPKRENERLQHRLQLQQETIARLAIDPDIQSTPKYAYPLICEKAAEAMAVQRASIWFLNADRTQLHCMDLYDARTGMHTSGNVIDAADAPAYFEALEEMKALNADNALDDERIQQLSAVYLSPAGITSMLDSGIRHEGKVVGVICLEHTGPKREWEPDEIMFAGRLSDQIGSLLTTWKLHESNRMFQLVIDTIPVRVFWKDLNLNYLGCNRSFAHDAGRKHPADVVGDNDFNMGWHDQAELYRSDDRRVIENDEEKVDFVEPQTTPDGDQIWLRTSKIPLRNRNNEIVGVLGTYQDITDQRRLEERLRHAQKMDSIGQLAGGVAHDFNNMLSGIVGAAEILEERLRGNQDLVKFVKIIEDASTRAAELTRKLLAFSRKANVTNEPVDLHRVIHDTIELLSQSIDKRISLQTGLQAASHILLGDATQLQNALLNLALNARDAMPDGGAIQISTANVPLTQIFPDGLEHEKAIVIRVRDNGCGMDGDVQQHIFDPFYTTKGIGKGTGLGLAAVYGTVREHNGQITVESEVGVGTEFQITLPTTTDEVDGGGTTKQQRAKGEGLVLLVDDEEIVRTITTSMLQTLGYDVLIARDGNQAVELYSKHRAEIRLILLDIVMPEMSGSEAFYQLKEVRQGIPVILCSGFTQDQGVDQLLADGAAGFLQKPYSIDQLADILERVLGSP